MRTLAGTISGWQADSPSSGRQSALSADTEARVVVVGGGLAGLAIAHQLARTIAPSDVLVLEATEVGAGASGRSTGIVGPGVGGPITGLVRRYGPKVARRMFAASLAGIDSLRRMAAALPDGCELSNGFQLVTAAAPGHAAQLRQQADILRDFGFDVSYLDRSATAEQIGTERYFGALCYPDIAMVNPWLLCQALKKDLLARGVRIAEGSPVTAFAGGSPATLTAAGRRVSADRVVLATDGFAASLHLFTTSVSTIRTHVLRTAAVAPDQLAATGWNSQGAVIDSRSFFNYFRLTAGGNVLFGGGPALIDARVSARGVLSVRARLEREFAETFPSLVDIPMTDFWSGITASTFDRLPIVGPVAGAAGVWFAGAWCGHGLALSAHTAELLVDPLTGKGTWPPVGKGAGPTGRKGAGPAGAPDLPWLRGDAGRMPSGPVGDLLLAGYLRGLDAADRVAVARAGGFRGKSRPARISATLPLGGSRG